MYYTCITAFSSTWARAGRWAELWEGCFPVYCVRLFRARVVVTYGRIDAHDLLSLWLILWYTLVGYLIGYIYSESFETGTFFFHDSNRIRLVYVYTFSDTPISCHFSHYFFRSTAMANGSEDTGILRKPEKDIEYVTLKLQREIFKKSKRCNQCGAPLAYGMRVNKTNLEFFLSINGVVGLMEVKCHRCDNCQLITSCEADPHILIDKRLQLQDFEVGLYAQKVSHHEIIHDLLELLHVAAIGDPKKRKARHREVAGFVMQKAKVLCEEWCKPEHNGLRYKKFLIMYRETVFNDEHKPELSVDASEQYKEMYQMMTKSFHSNKTNVELLLCLMKETLFDDPRPSAFMMWTYIAMLHADHLNEFKEMNGEVPDLINPTYYSDLMEKFASVDIPVGLKKIPVVFVLFELPRFYHYVEFYNQKVGPGKPHPVLTESEFKAIKDIEDRMKFLKEQAEEEEEDDPGPMLITRDRFKQVLDDHLRKADKKHVNAPDGIHKEAVPSEIQAMDRATGIESNEQEREYLRSLMNKMDIDPVQLRKQTSTDTHMKIDDYEVSIQSTMMTHFVKPAGSTKEYTQEEMDNAKHLNKFIDSTKITEIDPDTGNVKVYERVSFKSTDDDGKETETILMQSKPKKSKIIGYDKKTFKLSDLGKYKIVPVEDDEADVDDSYFPTLPMLEGAVENPPVEHPVNPPVGPSVESPVEPPVNPPVDCPVEPPVNPPVDSPVEPPGNPPVDSPVEPPVEPPVKLPVNPPVEPPVKLPVEPTFEPIVKPPIQSPVKPPVKPPVELPNPEQPTTESIPKPKPKPRFSLDDYPLRLPEIEEMRMRRLYLEREKENEEQAMLDEIEEMRMRRLFLRREKKDQAVLDEIEEMRMRRLSLEREKEIEEQAMLDEIEEMRMRRLFLERENKDQAMLDEIEEMRMRRLLIEREKEEQAMLDEIEEMRMRRLLIAREKKDQAMLDEIEEMRMRRLYFEREKEKEEKAMLDDKDPPKEDTDDKPSCTTTATEDKSVSTNEPVETSATGAKTSKKPHLPRSKRPHVKYGMKWRKNKVTYDVAKVTDSDTETEEEYTYYPCKLLGEYVESQKIVETAPKDLAPDVITLAEFLEKREIHHSLWTIKKKYIQNELFVVLDIAHDSENTRLPLVSASNNRGVSVPVLPILNPTSDSSALDMTIASLYGITVSNKLSNKHRNVFQRYVRIAVARARHPQLFEGVCLGAVKYVKANEKRVEVKLSAKDMQYEAKNEEESERRKIIRLLKRAGAEQGNSPC